MGRRAIFRQAAQSRRECVRSAPLVVGPHDAIVRLYDFDELILDLLVSDIPGLEPRSLVFGDCRLLVKGTCNATTTSSATGNRQRGLVPKIARNGPIAASCFNLKITLTARVGVKVVAWIDREVHGSEHVLGYSLRAAKCRDARQEYAFAVGKRWIVEQRQRGALECNRTEAAG
jgi:hypothetical protein